MQNFRTIVVAFAALTVVSTAWCEENELVKITGVVFDLGTDHPIPDLEVAVRQKGHYPDPSMDRYRSVTDKDGRYEIFAELKHIEELLLFTSMTNKHAPLIAVKLPDKISRKEKAGADFEYDRVFHVESIGIEPRQRLLVQVVDMDGAPVPMATVEYAARDRLMDNIVANVPNATVTDEKGFAEFPHLSIDWCPRTLIAKKIGLGRRGFRTGSLKISERLHRSNSKLPSGKTLAVIVLRDPIVIRGQLNYAVEQSYQHSAATLYFHETDQGRIDAYTRLQTINVEANGEFSFDAPPGLKFTVLIRSWGGDRKPNLERVQVPLKGKLRELGAITIGDEKAE